MRSWASSTSGSPKSLTLTPCCATPIRGAIRRLRFFSPTQVRIRDAGMNWGLAIADIRARQLQGIGVELHNFEADEGPMELLARDVVELPVS